MGLIADILGTIFRFESYNDFGKSDDSSSASESSIYDRLSEMETVFYNDNEDELPFALSSDNYDNDVGYDNDNISDDDSFHDSIEFEDISACPSFNIDGTPMISDSCIDVNGDPFGDPSSLHDDDMFDDDMFSSSFDDDY